MAIVCIIAVATKPKSESELYFYAWMAAVLFFTIVSCMIFLRENTWQLIDMINKENFLKAPISGTLIIPFIITFIKLTILFVKYVILV